MKFSKFALVTLAFAATVSVALAAEDSKISKIMKESMKGDNSLYKKVALGKGTDADAAKLLEYVKGLGAETPPKGDKAAWEEKCKKLVAAAEDVVAKKPTGLAELQEAGKCKTCHTDHKGK